MASRMGLVQHGVLAVLEVEVAQCALRPPAGPVPVSGEGMAWFRAALGGPAQARRCMGVAVAVALGLVGVGIREADLRAAADVNSS